MSNWKEWKGGERPVYGGAFVDVRLEDGSEFYGVTAKSVEWDKADGTFHAVTAWRISSNCVKVEEGIGGAMNEPGYEALASVLQRAYNLAARTGSESNKAIGKLLDTINGIAGTIIELERPAA